MSSDLIKIAQIGKTVGVKGELRLHIDSDFPEQFKKGSSFFISKDKILTIENFSKKKKTVKFVGYNTIDEASALVNKFLYSTAEKSYEDCKLKDGEYFWFDMIGSSVYEDDILLGEVKNIERFEPNEYLFISTNKELVEKGYPKQFLIPYIDRYIVDFDKDKKIVLVKDAMEILKSS